MTTSPSTAAVRAPEHVPVASRGWDVGLLAAVASAAAFGSSGPFAKALLATGWTSGAVVTARVGIAGLLLLIPALYAVRTRPHVLRRNAWSILSFALFAVAGCQVAYFNAVKGLPIGVALLLEYLGIMLVVLWMWLRHGQRPTPLSIVGMVAAIGGLALVVDVASGGAVDLVSIGWGLLAGVGLAIYFVIAAHADPQLPSVTLAGLGMLVGAGALAIFLAVGVLPFAAETAPVTLAGSEVPWWVAVAELSLIAAATAYVLGAVGARRLGSTVASFIGLTEVLFAVVLAWLLLGELPVGRQLVGGALILAGVVVVRWAQARSD